MSPNEIDSGLFSEDIQQFIVLLRKRAVRYLIVGGHAAVIHGNPRVTGATEVYFDRNAENCERLHQALSEFWGGDVPGISGARDVEDEGAITQFGRPPNRLDLINRIDGVTFDEAWSDRTVLELRVAGDVLAVPVIGRATFLRNKRASGRAKDLADVEALGDDSGRS